MYYSINEDSARTAWTNVHMSDYVPGSATAEYRAAVDAAAALADSRKQHVSRYFHGRIDTLLDSYARRLADWTNDYNRNAAAYPSQFIAGAGNYNLRRHSAQMAREDTLWKQYDDIKCILDRIRSVGSGPVDLRDPDARGQLESQLSEAQQQQIRMKEINAHFRKYHNLDPFPEIKINTFGMDLYGVPFPPYELTSIREKIKRISARIAELDALEAEKDSPADGIPFDGGQIIRNASENRLQILFDDIPGEDLRHSLKSYGFRWSPKNKAWQRQLTENALRDAQKILNI